MQRSLNSSNASTQANRANDTLIEPFVIIAGAATEQYPRLNSYGDKESVARLVEEALHFLPQAAGKTPFQSIIAPGSTVLLKPNWVLERNEAGFGEDCLITQQAFILAVLQQVVLAQPGKVIIGDAPVQSCRWDQIVTPEFREQVSQVAGPTTIEIMDFRRTIVQQNEQTFITHVDSEMVERQRYLFFDLGKDSLLEPISQPPGRFRVTMYDPRKLAQTHQPGHHQYLLCKEAFASDVILNLPKLKTHRKAGLTGALKNLVGLNGNKDYLPHHRVGGSALGGDCYPGLAPLKRLAEYCLDRANQDIDSANYAAWLQRARRLLRWHSRLGDTEIEGGWYGNDTVWRMSLDLNRILLYGQPDGSMADAPQRQIWSLTDAILCGQGEGPLASEPLVVGAVTLSNSSAAVDWVHAALLGLDPQRIPLLKHAFDSFRWPLSLQGRSFKIIHQGQELTLEQVRHKLGLACKPPRGWKGHCEWKPAKP